MSKKQINSFNKFFSLDINRNETILRPCFLKMKTSGMQVGLGEKVWNPTVSAQTTWVCKYMLGVVTCAWRVKSGTGSQ